MSIRLMYCGSCGELHALDDATVARCIKTQWIPGQESAWRYCINCGKWHPDLNTEMDRCLHASCRPGQFDRDRYDALVDLQIRFLRLETAELEARRDGERQREDQRQRDRQRDAERRILPHAGPYTGPRPSMPSGGVFFSGAPANPTDRESWLIGKIDRWCEESGD